MTRSRVRAWPHVIHAAEFNRTAPVLVLVVLATSTWAFSLDFSSWRRDTMQAADNAGVYLFIASPILAALSAWAVTKATMSLGDLARGVNERELIWRATWPPLAILSAGMHLLVLLAMVLAARVSGAVGSIDPLPVGVQVLSIPFFAALGAFIGDRFRSQLTAPVLLLVLLAVNTLLAGWGFRKITEVGTGSGDFIDLHLQPSYLLPKAVVFGAFIAFAMPIRHAPPPVASARRHLAPALALAFAVVALVSDQEPEAYAPGPRACRESARFKICGPVELTGHTAFHDAAVVSVRRALAQLAVDALPTRVDYVSRGATTLPMNSVAIAVTAQALSSRRLAAREVEVGFAYAMPCGDPTAPLGPADSVLRAHALLDGWLQHQLGTVEPGSYPTEDLAALMAVPATSRRHTLQRMFQQAWQCSDEIQGVS